MSFEGHILIVANVAAQIGNKTKNYGDHRFAALPRVHDIVLLYVDGKSVSVTVKAIYHFPKPIEGRAPDGDPAVTISVFEND